MPVSMDSANSFHVSKSGVQGINTQTGLAFLKGFTDTTGTYLSLMFSQAVTGGAGGLTFTDGSNTYALTYYSGTGTNTLVYQIGTPVNAGDACTIAYASGNGNIASVAGSKALGSFSTTPVTNNTTQGGGSQALKFNVATNSMYIPLLAAR